MYLQSLNTTDRQFKTIPKNSFITQRKLDTISVSNLQKCTDYCSKNLACSGATFDSVENNCLLFTGTGNLNLAPQSTAIVRSSLYYGFLLQELNEKLMELNKQIQEYIHQHSDEYRKRENEITKYHQILHQNSDILQEDNQHIQRLIVEHQNMNSVYENGNLTVSSNYFYYLVYLFLFLFILFLFGKVLLSVRVQEFFSKGGEKMKKIFGGR
jgi:HrpA-like RNA helicase